jgi:hypothetical protein
LLRILSIPQIIDDLMTYKCLLVSVFLYFSLLFGCLGTQKALEIPSFDPGKGADGILAAIDKDADKSISVTEASASPGIQAGFARFDADGNKSISRDELQSRFTQLVNCGVAIMPVNCTVTFKSKPLAGATVKFIPEPFLGGAIVGAEGTTDASGFTIPTVSDGTGTSGMQFGIYKVEITHPSIAIPEKYNTQTTLGCDISPIDRGADVVEFSLK